jgi:hypothetical protein
MLELYHFEQRNYHYSSKSEVDFSTVHLGKAELSKRELRKKDECREGSGFGISPRRHKVTEFLSSFLCVLSSSQGDCDFVVEK